MGQNYNCFTQTGLRYLTSFGDDGGLKMLDGDNNEVIGGATTIPTDIIHGIYRKVRE